MTVSDLTASSFAQPQPVLAVVVGGLIVGVLDLVYAIAVYSPRRPILVPQTIASGILGLRSYDGGLRTAALGVALHFVIALGGATVYYLASRRLALMIGRTVLCGLVYGALVYAFMHIVVLPLQRRRNAQRISSTKLLSLSNTVSASVYPSRSRCATTRADFSLNARYFTEVPTPRGGSVMARNSRHGGVTTSSLTHPGSSRRNLLISVRLLRSKNVNPKAPCEVTWTDSPESARTLDMFTSPALA